MEAMAIGLPCISTDCPCGGPASLIENGINGVLVPCNDIEALAEQIVKMYMDGSMSSKLGQNAKESLKAYYPDVINPQWEELITSIH